MTPHGTSLSHVAILVAGFTTSAAGIAVVWALGQRLDTGPRGTSGGRFENRHAGGQASRNATIQSPGLLETSRL